MNLVIDCREAALIARCRAKVDAFAGVVTLVVRQLALGDIVLEKAGGIDPLLLIERKSLPDMLSSITDGRYAEQSFRLAHHPQISPHNVVYLLEGSITALKSAADRQRCFSVLASCQFFKGFSTMRTESTDDTANYLLATAAKLGAELKKGKAPFATQNATESTNTTTTTSYASVVHSVKKDNLNADNIAVVFLSQIPGFSAASAQCVMDGHPGGLRQLLEDLGTLEGRDRVRELKLGGARRIGDAAVVRLCSFLRPDVDIDGDKPLRKKRTLAPSVVPGPKRKAVKKEKVSVFPSEEEEEE